MEYIQYPGALKELDKIKDKKVYMIADKRSYDTFDNVNNFKIEVFNGECSKKEIERLTCNVVDFDVIIGFGGGKILDVAKAVAHFNKKYLIIIPTSASNDGPCTAVSVLYHEDGSLDRYLYLDKNPDLVLVDTSIIIKCPTRLTIAGMGDALSTYFEARANGKINDKARECFDNLMKYGIDSISGFENKELGELQEIIIRTNIYLSGIGFEKCGTNLAHEISYKLNCPKMHGEKVAYGTLVQLCYETAEEFNEVFKWCKALGLPTSLKDLEIEMLDLGEEINKSILRLELLNK